MHPAPSLILFSVLSGLGFGLMAWLGAGEVQVGGWIAAGFAAAALVLAGAGLVASLFHLGQPRRALKAFSQWRSSWLSREAAFAVATSASFAIYAALWALLGLRVAPLGWMVTGLAIATVGATAMIYAQMRSVPRWRSPLTPALFLVASLAGGALIAGALPAARVLLATLALAQLVDWRLGDRRFAAAATTLASATGLGGLGRLRSFERPHTGANYLTREMVFVIGRRHADKLRAIGLGLAALLPLAVMLALPVGNVLDGVTLLSHLTGMLVLRWLFFAQAEHVVGLYYGEDPI
ncbi:MAG: dimethyl sulfoxide reductase anchor subunit [Rhodobacteraceae bacterium]|nr:dimethyl sulfoxide reductase anchor subunit [Paracoccaceae bacterium]